MKKLLSLVLVICLLIIPSNAFVNANQIEANESIYIENIEFDIDPNSLEEGVQLLIYTDGSTEIVETNSSPSLYFEASTRASVALVFHMSYNGSHELTWRAVGSKDYLLTYVSGNAYVKSTAFINPTYYLKSSFRSIGLSGVVAASGYIGKSSCPGNNKKVRVGWSSLYITTIKQGKTNFGSGSSLVTHKH